MSTARLYALVSLSADWHGGQWTREYRIGCRAAAALRRKGITRPLDQIQRGRGKYGTGGLWPQRFRDEYDRERDRFAPCFYAD